MDNMDTPINESSIPDMRSVCTVFAERFSIWPPSNLIFLSNALQRKAGILIVLQNFAKRNTGGCFDGDVGDEKVYHLCAVLSDGKKFRNKKRNNFRGMGLQFRHSRAKSIYDKTPPDSVRFCIRGRKLSAVFFG